MFYPASLALPVAESTDCEFKSDLEVKKPKSWLKTVSAFANGSGGTMYFGVADGGRVIGLTDPNRTSDQISSLIKERLSPIPGFTLTVQPITHESAENKAILILKVPSGENTPCYYRANGMIIAFIRIGNQSHPADAQQLTKLVLRGVKVSYDSLPSGSRVEDATFAAFDREFKVLKKLILSANDYISFGICSSNGELTNAGLMFSDACPLLQSRVFCTRWDGLDKSGSVYDAVDDKEFEGDLISQLTDSHSFVRLNSKKRWKKMSDHRIDKPDYADRAVFEALANALMHRDYTVVGSEVHVDMYDDRLEVYSPGGMPDGSLIQTRDLEEVPSLRRNPVIAEIFQRLGFIERRGSGLKKIREATEHIRGYTAAHAPVFRSTTSAFHVILKNMNYGDFNDAAHQVNPPSQPTKSTHQVNPPSQPTKSTHQDDRLESLLEFCSVPRTREEMQQHLRITDRGYFRTGILKPLLDAGLLEMTIPDKPTSRSQKYVTRQETMS